jgi:hypothetical protein
MAAVLAAATSSTSTSTVAVKMIERPKSSGCSAGCASTPSAAEPPPLGCAPGGLVVAVAAPSEVSTSSASAPCELAEPLGAA